MRHHRSGAVALMSGLILGLFLLCPAEAGQDSAAQLIERLVERDGLGEINAAYLRRLTPPLLEYLGARHAAEALEVIYRAESTAELRTSLTGLAGPDLIDFGSGLFEYFEDRAGKESPSVPNSWRVAVSDRFVFFFRPGSPAERDADFISASSEEALSAIISSLGIEGEAARNAGLLHVSRPGDMAPETDIPSGGRICVYLHPGRALAGDKLKKTMGVMSFGATVLSEGPDEGAGRLTARIDVLYLNALSLAVLHHEVAHAALFLGSFDSASLAAKPLQGESDLRKAFFAGYKSIPPFLQEGIGDYIYYYRVLCSRWPLLPPPVEIMRGLFVSREFIPLNRLLKEGAAFRSQRRKAYSLEAATVVDYLLRSHGSEKLKSWFGSPEKDGVKSFEKTYGYSVEDLETRWKSALLGENEK